MNAFLKFWIGAWLAAASWCVQAQMPEAPEMAVKAYLLMDVTANQVLAAKDPEETETENATESETAAADLIDPLLSAEAAQLRRKRLEVSACS